MWASGLGTLCALCSQTFCAFSRELRLSVAFVDTFCPPHVSVSENDVGGVHVLTRNTWIGTIPDTCFFLSTPTHCPMKKGKSVNIAEISRIIRRKGRRPCQVSVNFLIKLSCIKHYRKCQFEAWGFDTALAECHVYCLQGNQRASSSNNAIISIRVTSAMFPPFVFDLVICTTNHLLVTKNITPAHLYHSDN